jgi:uncharacterized protein
MDAFPRFTDLTLVLTERCNLRCPYCYVPTGQGRRMPRELALEATERFLRRAPARRPVSLSFFGGEPFLEPELMREVMQLARRLRPRGLSFNTPTNGTRLDAAALDLVQEHGLRLALSVDGVGADRPDADGNGSLDRLQPLLPRLAPGQPITRMTVTPDNVDRLLRNVQGIFAAGLQRIMYLPALERPWPAPALQAWRHQHRLLADWACDRFARRQPLPDLTVLEGIIGRLEGQAPGRCGAGVTQAAVAPDGQVYGCYRSAYDPDAQRLALGRVDGGPVNETLLAAYARLDPRRARPEQGSCRDCPARDGCTAYCPALGHVLLGDLRAVPADACALMRVQVDTCREILRRMRRLQRQSRRRASAQVAAAAVALSLAGSSCGDNKTGGQDGGQDGGALDRGIQAEGGGPDLLLYDSPMPGLCDAPWHPDSRPPPDQTIQRPEGPVPGVCPWRPDAQVKRDTFTPGLCPPPRDIGPGPGLCPFRPDATTIPKKDTGGPGPGICMIRPDQGTPKRDRGGPTPGVCPFPGIC